MVLAVFLLGINWNSLLAQEIPVERSVDPATDAPSDGRTTYITFANTQIYTSKRGDLWLFADIDTRTKRQNYMNPPDIRTKNKFLAFMITPKGVISQWESVLEDLTAHENFAIFLERKGTTYAVRYPGKVFQFSQDKTGGNHILEVSPSELGLSLGVKEWADAYRQIEQGNEHESFDLILTTRYGGPFPTIEHFRKRKLEIGVDFQYLDNPPGMGGGQSIRLLNRRS